MEFVWNDQGVVRSWTHFGPLEIACVSGKVYKDTSRQFMIYLSAPNGSREIITLSKIRGHLEDAKREAERLFTEVRMNNDERFYKLCECMRDLIDVLPNDPNLDWIRKEVVEIMKDVDAE